jgi:hypothetical protein
MLVEPAQLYMCCPFMLDNVMPAAAVAAAAAVTKINLPGRLAAAV